MIQRKNFAERKKAIRRRNRIIKRIFLAVMALLLVVAIVLTSVFFYYKQQGMKNVFPDLENYGDYAEEIEYDGHTYKYNKDVIAIAFIGIDREEMQTVDQTDFVGANDTDIVVAINTVSGAVDMIAIPRDTVVDIDIYQNGAYGGLEKNPLYLAYAYGDGAELSCRNAVDAISRVMMNVPIDKYYALDLSGIAPINDAIGGVILKSQLDLPQYDISVGDIVTLKGDMAESYVRTRSMTDIEASLRRTDRQVQYLQSFADQTFPAVLLDVGTVTDLYNVGLQYSRSNINAQDLTYLTSLLIAKGTNSFVTHTLEGTMTAEADSAGEGIVHALFTPDKDALMKIVLDTFYLRVS